MSSVASVLRPQLGQPLQISIVMPCLNEAETLASCIQKAWTTIHDNQFSGEVIVADNGSTDGSQAIAAREGARVVHAPVRGYGAALMAGIQAARSSYILMADADDSYDFAHLPRFLSALHEGAELVMGNRFSGGIQPGAMPWSHRYLGNPVLSFLGRLFFHTTINDFHCGIRAFHKNAIERLHLTTTGMEFASEMIVKASLMGLQIREVPTTLMPDGRSRAPHLRTWRDGWRHLRFLLLYSPRWLFLYPGLALSLLGLALSAWLIPAQRTVAGITLDVDTLAYALGCVLLGFHACVFAVSAKLFGIEEGLLPSDAAFERWSRGFRVEVGLLVGAVLCLAGLLSGGYAVSLWYRTGFGHLDPTQSLRITLPSAAALMLGVEIIFSSFFFGLLGLHRR